MIDGQKLEAGSRELHNGSLIKLSNKISLRWACRQRKDHGATFFDYSHTRSSGVMLASQEALDAPKC